MESLARQTVDYARSYLRLPTPLSNRVLQFSNPLCVGLLALSGLSCRPEPYTETFETTVSVATCLDDSDTRAPKPPEARVATGQANLIGLIGDSLAFGRITSLRWVDDSLAIATDRLSDNRVHLLNVNRRSVISSFGRNGKGPGEFTDPRWVIPSSPTTGAWIYDGGAARLTEVALAPPDSIGARRRDIHLQTPVPIAGLFWFRGSLVANVFSADRLFLRFDSTGAPLHWLPHPGLVAPDSVDHNGGRLRINRTRTAYVASTQRVAVAYQASNRIDLYDENLCLLRSLRGPIDIIPRFRIWKDAAGGRRFAWEPDNELAYVSVDANANAVVGLMCGDCQQRRSLPTVVHVFDWETDELTVINLDLPVYAVALSPSTNVLLGAAQDPYPHVRIWHLDGLHDLHAARMPPLRAAANTARRR